MQLKLQIINGKPIIRWNVYFEAGPCIALPTLTTGKVCVVTERVEMAELTPTKESASDSQKVNFKAYVWI
jgi:hypothetical protein